MRPIQSIISFFFCMVLALQTKDRIINHQDLSPLHTVSQSSKEVVNYDSTIQSWIKLVIFDKSKPEERAFLINPGYQEQIKYDYDKDAQDQFGMIYNPGSEYFYGVFLPNEIIILSTRKDPISKVVRYLDFKQIAPIIPDQQGNYSGGLEILDQFKEGYCIKIELKAEDDSTQWILCYDSIQQRDIWFRNILQKVKELPALVNSPQINVEATINSNLSLTDINNSLDKQDGSWRIINDWSSCTVACGGGTQTLQRQCVPPKNGGKPCVGQEVLIRTCNNFPCQDSVQVGYNKTLPTQIKTLQFSRRYQREERCIIKEGDLDLVREDLNQFKIKPRIPTRVVMNNQTISIFESDNYKDMVFQSPLKFISVEYSDMPGCFTLYNIQVKAKKILCAMSSFEGDATELINHWKEQILFFRTNCNKKLPVIQENNEQIIKIKQQEVQAAQEQFLKSHMLEGNPQFEKEMDNLQDVALNSFQKEMQYEALAEKEEVMREQLLEKQDRQILEEKKEQMECLDNMKKQNTVIEQMKIQKISLRDQIEKMKSQIKDMISQARVRQEKKIELMQILSEKHQRETKGEAQLLKIKMASNYVNGFKKGNSLKCTLAKDQKAIDTYCLQAYNNDLDKYVPCRVHLILQDQNDFCFMCCENEFGFMRKNERNSCYEVCSKNMIENIQKKNPQPQNDIKVL